MDETSSLEHLVLAVSHISQTSRIDALKSCLSTWQTLDNHSFVLVCQTILEGMDRFQDIITQDLLLAVWERLFEHDMILNCVKWLTKETR